MTVDVSNSGIFFLLLFKVEICALHTGDGNHIQRREVFSIGILQSFLATSTCLGLEVTPLQEVNRPRVRIWLHNGFRSLPVVSCAALTRVPDGVTTDLTGGPGLLLPRRCCVRLVFFEPSRLWLTIVSSFGAEDCWLCQAE